MKYGILKFIRCDLKDVEFEDYDDGHNYYSLLLFDTIEEAEQYIEDKSYGSGCRIIDLTVDARDELRKLRIEFAKSAMTGILANQQGSSYSRSSNKIAEASFAMADAMIEKGELK